MTLKRIAVVAVAVGLVSAWAPAQGTATGTVTIELKGITGDNAAKVETALVKLERDGFCCQGCDYFAKAAGQCPGCKTALVPEKTGALLRDVKIDPAKGTVVFGVAGPHIVRLGDIEAALKPLAIDVDATRFTIGPFTRITVTGVESEDAGPALEKALLDAKLYDTVKANADTESSTAILIVGGTKAAPTLETFRKTVEKAGPFKITQVSWAAACPKCAEKGMKRAGCMSCWEKGT